MLVILYWIIAYLGVGVMCSVYLGKASAIWRNDANLLAFAVIAWWIMIPVFLFYVIGDLLQRLFDIRED